MKKYSLFLSLLFFGISSVFCADNGLGQSLSQTVEIRGLGNRCLDIYQGVVTNGTPLVLNACNNSINQKWSKDGALIVLWPCLELDNQRFTALPYLWR